MIGTCSFIVQILMIFSIGILYLYNIAYYIEKSIPNSQRKYNFVGNINWLFTYRSILETVKNNKGKKRKKGFIEHLSYCLSKHVDTTVVCADLQYDGVSKAGVLCSLLGIIYLTYTSLYICLFSNIEQFH